MKTAFLFSGQGAQYPGMGKELYENYEEAKAVFDEIDVDFDVKKLCFEGPSEMLNDTQYAQCAIFVMSMATAAVLEKEGIYADVCAGLSLGEYSALAYGKAFTIRDGANIVRERGKLMATALPYGTTTMAAVLMLGVEQIKEACEEVSALGICEIANYNCPGQVVITGENAAVEACSQKCIEKGARKVIPLQVSGAFHSSLLKDAGKELAKVLAAYPMHASQVSIYHNSCGTTSERDLRTILSEQISSSVYFEQTIMHMLEDGVRHFVEVGPGKAASGFVKKCAKGFDVKITNVEDIASLTKTLALLKG